MSNEAEQIAQRQAKLDELVALGVAPYPTTFDRIVDRFSDIVAEHGATSGEALEAEQAAGARRRPHPRHPRRSARRTSSSCPTGVERLQVYVRARLARERDFEIYKLLDLGDHVGVEGPSVPDEDERAHGLGVDDRVPGQVPAADAGEVARADRRRDALPPALSRSHRQSRLAAGLRDAREAVVPASAGSSTRAGSSKSRRR